MNDRKVKLVESFYNTKCHNKALLWIALITECRFNTNHVNLKHSYFLIACRLACSSKVGHSVLPAKARGDILRELSIYFRVAEKPHFILNFIAMHIAFLLHAFVYLHMFIYKEQARKQIKRKQGAKGNCLSDYNNWTDTFVALMTNHSDHLYLWLISRKVSSTIII